MSRRLEDYPPGVQDLLKWAGFHLEQLDILEREFRAWQALQSEGAFLSLQAVAAVVSVECNTAELPPTPTRAERRELLEGATRAEIARQRWEARARAAVGGGKR